MTSQFGKNKQLLRYYDKLVVSKKFCDVHQTDYVRSLLSKLFHILKIEIYIFFLDLNVTQSNKELITEV